ncbi:MAG TPA: hypothetical protein VMV20_04155 [Chitinophagaceae bacterium]|nr:hypothetical protein [Chitinophagaceae bacterium]
MERKTFIGLSALSVLGLYLPLEECKPSLTPEQDTLSTPTMLSKLFSAARIRNLGKQYLNQHPAESSRNLLEKELREGISGNGDQISRDLSSKIRQDFQGGRTVLLEGWILSQTESRQCAYYDLSHPA